MSHAVVFNVPFSRVNGSRIWPYTNTTTVGPTDIQPRSHTRHSNYIPTTPIPKNQSLPYSALCQKRCML